jgi:hypothetical protein
VVSAATIAMQRCSKHLYNNRGTVFSVCSVPRSYLEDNWHYGSVESSGAECSPAGNGVTTEDEESPLLRFVTRKHLVKTLQRDNH